MLTIYTERLITRLSQIVTEIQGACDFGLDYYDRLREFKDFCDNTPALAQILRSLPNAAYDFAVGWRDIPNQWRSGKQGYGMRWDAIKQMIDGGPDFVDQAWLHIGIKTQYEGLRKVTDIFVIPVYHYLLDELTISSTILYVLLRYKRWAEWFEADILNKGINLIFCTSLRFAK